MVNISLNKRVIMGPESTQKLPTPLDRENRSKKQI